ncbi:hypothetical protein GCM10010287_07260 [Streptomyces variabilis]|uniref:Uncharacterized protein n=1 Tax=Streptomyces variabilis TaxID=67372 RepID=A0ABQ2TT26_9ACTN|nr:hypothetical protein GCM10010265_14130 [Streptomyces griseoincarnatus]GGT37407.1 hypothetical protein GCM10010287_07260 [Streptomyces variabilis]
MSYADAFNELRQDREEVLKDLHSRVMRLHREADVALSKISLKAAKVARESEEIPCLVRWTPGPELTIYHSADAPCGRVRDRQNFRRLSEKAAKDASPHRWLERCSACSWSQAAMIYGKGKLGQE